MGLSGFEKKGIRRLLIRSTNWIGDAVMTTPAVRAVRRNFPGAHISMLVKPWVAPVFSESPHVDQLLLYDTNGRHHGFGGRLTLVRDLRQVHFDAAILLQNAFEAALITFLAGIPIRIGFDTDGRRLLLSHPVRRRPAHRRVHQTAYYLGMLEGAGLRPVESKLELTVGREDRRRALRFLEELPPNGVRVGINPSATFGPAKQWPLERFARLADRLADEYGARILLFGGPGDESLGHRMTQMMHHPILNLAGRTRLGEAMALIEACDLFITNDSGLMHVAAALQVPLVAIFGSTDPVATGPLGSRSRVVRTAMACSPCLKPECPEGHLRCMEEINVETVYATAVEFL